MGIPKVSSPHQNFTFGIIPHEGISTAVSRGIHQIFHMWELYIGIANSEANEIIDLQESWANRIVLLYIAGAYWLRTSYQIKRMK